MNLQPNRNPNQPPDPGLRTFLYIMGVSTGVGLLLAALVLLLQGIGVIQKVADTIIWAIVLFSLGLGILMGLNRSKLY
ncbi:MAG: hypothetical protein F6J89_31625, partial [Symploca sp. SIO1C4]|nr:hypothetical protein [Symploca sp. SIO1C4]